MVEANPSKTQLPNPRGDSDSDEKFYPYGTKEELIADVKFRLQDVDINSLEQALLDKYLQEPQENATAIVETLRKIQTRNQVNSAYYARKVGKLIPLFDVHDFWFTQPVPKYFEPLPTSSYDKAIEVKQVGDINPEPYGLPEGYYWCSLDLNQKQDLDELFDLLKNHYVEDSDGKFRFEYTTKFLKWALSPPGNKPDWLVAVRGGKGTRLYGFISAIPVSMVVNGQKVEMAEINFLCVHKKLREKRLAPLLIKEVTRRVNLYDVWQAIYTSGTTLPTPFATAPYFHRNLNPKKLVDVAFSFKPANQTMAQFVKMHKLPNQPTVENLRMMTEADVEKVRDALNEHLAKNYKVHITFSKDEIAHFFLPREDVLFSYVVEDESGNVQDFLSFYALNSQILNNEHYSHIYAAYAFYNFVKDNDTERMKLLMRDMLILAKKNEFDVLNMTEVLNHTTVKDELMFKPGDGRLAHYLYNWRIRSISPSSIGIVLV